MLRTVIAFLILLASPHAGAESAGEHEGHGSEHAFHRNVVAACVGVTSEDCREKALTLGLEYERRFTPTFGLGVVAERAFGDLDFWVFAVPFAWHNGPWKLYAAPGVEDSDEHGSEFLFRVGVEYGFEVGNFEIAPQLDIDFVDGQEVLVLGVTIGKGY